MVSTKIAALAALCLTVAACNPQQPATPAATDPAPTPAAEAAPAADATAGLTVVNWGQRSTKVAEPFNVQADGNSGVSFELSRPAPQGDFVISFDGKPLTGVVVNGVIITATIPGDYLATAGSFPVVIENASQGLRLEAGDFTVVAP